MSASISSPLTSCGKPGKSTCKYFLSDSEYVRGGTALAKMFKQTLYALREKEHVYPPAGFWADPNPLPFVCKELLKNWKSPGPDERGGDAMYVFHSTSFPELDAAAACMTGSRDKMEDEHLAMKIELLVGETTYSARLFGVFDGHGSRDPATQVKSLLPERLHTHVQQLSLQFTDLEDIIPRAFTKACVELDLELRNEVGGTCAVCALEINGRIYFPNCGDSRGMLFQRRRSVKMTEDAHPNAGRFKHRALRDGHEVSKQYGAFRVNGLGVARDIGLDFVTARPKVSFATQSNQPDDLEDGVVHYQKGDIVVLACDGLWDIATTKDVEKEVSDMLDKCYSLQRIASTLTKSALHSGDNVSVLLFEIGAQDPE